METETPGALFRITYDPDCNTATADSKPFPSNLITFTDSHGIAVDGKDTSQLQTDLPVNVRTFASVAGAQPIVGEGYQFCAKVVNSNYITTATIGQAGVSTADTNAGEIDLVLPGIGIALVLATLGMAVNKYVNTFRSQRGEIVLDEKGNQIYKRKNTL